MASESIAIVGLGAVGTALAHALSAAGMPVAFLSSRSPEKAGALASRIAGARAVDASSAAAGASLVVLAVGDSVIEEAARSIAGSISRDGAPLVVHTSGSRSVEALAPAADAGAATGGLHPLSAVVRARSAAEDTPVAYASVFRGAAFALEGTEAVVARLTIIARALGGHPFPIAASDKPLYHLGASMLAAFSAGLAQAAWKQMVSSGAPRHVASAGVAHLLRSVANNIERADTPAHALTGPVARGDAGGVRRQAAAARQLSPQSEALYWAHVQHNIVLAREAGRISAEVAEALSQEASAES